MALRVRVPETIAVVGLTQLSVTTPGRKPAQTEGWPGEVWTRRKAETGHDFHVGQESRESQESPARQDGAQTFTQLEIAVVARPRPRFAGIRSGTFLGRTWTG